MIASLPMYDHPAVRGDWDALWAAIRDRLRQDGIDAPADLQRSDDLFAQWRSPSLLLGQVCGLPFRQEFHRSTCLVGAMDFGLDGSPAGFYHSLFVVREDDPRQCLSAFADARLTYNEASSHSGWGTAHASGVPFDIGPPSGSHRNSARWIIDGRADIAAIDAISWRLIRRHMREAVDLKVIARSASTPGQALITACPSHAPALRRALSEGIGDLPEATRHALGVRGFVPLPAQAWLQVPNPPAPQASRLRIAC